MPLDVVASYSVARQPILPGLDALDGAVGGVVPSRGRNGGSIRFDEMVDPATGVREAWLPTADLLRTLGGDGLAERRNAVVRMLADDAVTYRPLGSGGEQRWDLDPVPMLIDAAAWRELEAGLVQRSRLLDLILTDLYGPRELITRGLIAPELVFGHPGFVHEVDQVRLPGANQLFLAAADLARDATGRWIVLSDRTQAPSGAGYAMENRRVVSRVLPDLYRDAGIHRISPFFHAMRVALQQLAPSGTEAPRVVLLTPGAHSETAFDQAYLSSLLGFPLVEGNDLVVRDGRLWQRSVGRLEAVDVVLRRLDAWFCDPLELRGDSQLGVPGLLEANRLGNVSIVNGLGAGVLENPALLPLLPALSRDLLGEDLSLPSAQTWWCGDALGLRHVLARIGELIIKPVASPAGSNDHVGHQLSRSERDTLSARIKASPGDWVGQEVVDLGTAPTVSGRLLEPRPAVLRSFAVASEGSYHLMPGGLTRVALRRDAVSVTNQNGAIAKDVWIVAPERDHVWVSVPMDPATPEAMASAVSPRVADDLFWLGRYAERTEDTARLIRVVENRLADVHPGADVAIARSAVVLLEALTAVTTTWPGFLGDGSARRLAAPLAELRSVVGDDSRPGALAHSARRMRELANEVRDQLSNDTWIVLSGLERALAAGPDLPSVLARVLEALLAFAGLAAESMVRDTGWRFLDCGRRIERGVQVIRLVEACLVTVQAPDVEDLLAESVLVAGESIITHRRRYAARSGVESVLELLLFDRGNPRSLAHQLDRLTYNLDQIPQDGPLADQVRARLLSAAERLHADTPATLAVSESGRRVQLDALVTDVARDLRSLTDALEAAHFAQPAPLHPFGLLEEVS